MEVSTWQERGGVIWLEWNDIMVTCKRLAMQIKQEFDPAIVVGIARGGVIPASILASMLRVDFLPIRLSRRWQDQVVQSKPRVIVPITDDVQNKLVVIVDEMSVTGDTLRMAAKEAIKKGARKVKTCALYARMGSWVPTWYGQQTDALVIQPWNREVIRGDEFELHPDYQRAVDNIQDMK